MVFRLQKKLKIEIQFLINFMNLILSIANNLTHWLCHLFDYISSVISVDGLYEKEELLFLKNKILKKKTKET